MHFERKNLIRDTKINVPFKSSHVTSCSLSPLKILRHLPRRIKRGFKCGSSWTGELSEKLELQADQGHWYIMPVSLRYLHYDCSALESNSLFVENVRGPAWIFIYTDSHIHKNECIWVCLSGEYTFTYLFKRYMCISRLIQMHLLLCMCMCVCWIIHWVGPRTILRKRPHMHFTASLVFFFSS